MSETVFVGMVSSSVVLIVALWPARPRVAKKPQGMPRAFVVYALLVMAVVLVLANRRGRA